MLWKLGSVANVAIAIGYLAIALAIIRPLVRTRQLHKNRLGLGTAAIFLSCAVGHAAHAFHLVGPSLGHAGELGTYARLAIDGHIVAVDVLTATIGALYWGMRRSYGRLFDEPSLFVDLDERRRTALSINDSIVQQLVVAQMALERGEDQKAADAVRVGLDAARKMMIDVVEENIHLPQHRSQSAIDVVVAR